MDHVLGEVKLGTVQSEDFTGTHRLLSDREDRSLKDESVVVGAALARTAAQSLVLLVADDLEVWSIDPALALACPKSSELVTVDQVTIACVIKELTDSLLGIAALG